MVVLLNRVGFDLLLCIMWIIQFPIAHSVIHMGKLNCSHMLIMRLLKNFRCIWFLLPTCLILGYTCEHTVTWILFKEKICAALHLLTLQSTPKEKGAIPSEKKVLSLAFEVFSAYFLSLVCTYIITFEAPLPACLGHVYEMVAVIRGQPCAHAITDIKVAWQSPVRAD